MELKKKTHNAVSVVLFFFLGEGVKLYFYLNNRMVHSSHHCYCVISLHDYSTLHYYIITLLHIPHLIIMKKRFFRLPFLNPKVNSIILSCHSQFKVLQAPISQSKGQQYYFVLPQPVQLLWPYLGALPQQKFIWGGGLCLVHVYNEYTVLSWKKNRHRALSLHPKKIVLTSRVCWIIAAVLGVPPFSKLFRKDFGMCTVPKYMLDISYEWIVCKFGMDLILSFSI